MREREYHWVGEAMALAVRARAGGDVPVGALVLGPPGAREADQVIGVGWNTREAASDPAGHAEIMALRAAAEALGTWRLDGCDLYVSLEPCTMCAGALVLARVGRVVFGAWEPKTGAVGSLWDVVRDRRLNHRPDVRGGVLEAECVGLLDNFFGGRR